METLHETLWNHTVEDLKVRLKLLNANAKTARKADLIEAIEESLSGKSLRDFWHSLPQPEQQAIAEACYSPDLTLHEERVTAKYGECPAFFIPRKDQPESKFRSWDPGDPSRWTALLFQPRYGSQHLIPDDLANNLRGLANQPEALTITPLPSPIDEEGLLIRKTEHEALRESAAFLRLAEQGNLRTTAKTGMPTASGKKTMLTSLSGGDFFPPETAYPPNKKRWQQEIGSIKLVGWVRLLQASGYLTTGTTKSSLTNAGIKALSKPRHETIRHLWTKWLSNNKFDELNRVEDIKGQKAKGHMTAKPARRKAITAALLKCPSNKWIDTQTFSSFMQAEQFDFEISHDHYKLYIGDPQYGHFDYSGYGGWNILQFRYILALLFEYAATLGLIDIAYVHPGNALDDYRDQWGADDLEWLSRYDGLRAFRITNLGAYCLGKTATFKESQPETTLRLKLSSNLCIHLLSDTIEPAETLLLETWAERTSDRNWRLDPLRARDAIERGNSPDDFLSFLQQCDDQPVPETIQGFLKTSLSNGTALQDTGEARLFNCRDSKTADMILEQNKLKKICHRCGETQLAVPAEHLQKFQKHIRSLGLGFN